MKKYLSVFKRSMIIYTSITANQLVQESLNGY